jgi:tetratricopeptide (TPR) repeat protein
LAWSITIELHETQRSIKIPGHRVQANDSIAESLDFSGGQFHMKKFGYAVLSATLCTAIALPVMAQQPSPAELACNAKYGTYYAKQGDIALFDAFVNEPTCKDNQYRNGAFSLLLKSMMDSKNWKGVMEVANRYEKDVPTAPPQSKVYFLSQSMTAAAQAGDAAKVIEFGERVIAIDPDNLNALLIVTTTIPLNLPTDPSAMEKALAKAMEYAKKLVAMAKPAAIDDKTWQTAVMGPAHGVIGFVNLQKAQYEDAEKEFDQAVKINPKDQLTWYRYGLAATKITIAAQGLIGPAYDEVNKNTTLGPERDAAVAKRDAIEKDFEDKREKAIDILISAVALPDPNITKVAKVTLESLYNPKHNNTNAGLDELIEKRKAELK